MSNPLKPQLKVIEGGHTEPDPRKVQRSDAARKMLAPLAVAVTVGAFAGAAIKSSLSSESVRTVNVPAATAEPLTTTTSDEVPADLQGYSRKVVTVQPGEGIDAQIQKVSPEAYAGSQHMRDELRQDLYEQDPDGKLVTGEQMSVIQAPLPEVAPVPVQNTAPGTHVG